MGTVNRWEQRVEERELDPEWAARRDLDVGLRIVLQRHNTTCAPGSRLEPDDVASVLAVWYGLGHMTDWIVSLTDGSAAFVQGYPNHARFPSTAMIAVIKRSVTARAAWNMVAKERHVWHDAQAVSARLGYQIEEGGRHDAGLRCVACGSVWWEEHRFLRLSAVHEARVYPYSMSGEAGRDECYRLTCAECGSRVPGASDD